MKNKCDSITEIPFPQYIHNNSEYKTLLKYNYGTYNSSITKFTQQFYWEKIQIFLLLLYHADASLKKVYFKSLSSKLFMRSCDILKTKAMLGPKMCDLMPLAHAISGCDSRSPVFGVSKGFTLKKLEENDSVRSQAHEFCNIKKQKRKFSLHFIA